MISVSVLYLNKEGARFDATYYTKTHVPMVLARLGNALKGVVVETGLGGGEPGAPAPFAAAFHALYESVEAFQAAFHPHAGEIFDDIPNYTDITPLVQIGSVSVATLEHHPMKWIPVHGQDDAQNQKLERPI